MIPDYLRKEHSQLIKEMNDFAVGWHRQGKCACMSQWRAEDIDELTFTPCPHLSKAQWKFFKLRVNELDDTFAELWANRLHTALREGAE